MKPILSAKSLNWLDEESARLGVDPLLLMESASRGAADWISEHVPPHSRRRVVALAGKGGNGGDALGIARWLGLRGAEVWAVVLGEPKGAAERQAAAFSACFPDRLFSATTQDDLAQVVGLISGADLIIDGLLGVGGRGPLRGLLAQAAELINKSPGLIASIDLPSGLCADSGEVEEPAVEADLTLAMGAFKPCHFLPPAAARCGELALIPVAYPPGKWEELLPVAWLLDADYCRTLLPFRDPFGHKGTFGRVLVVGSAVGMAGAAALAAEAALRAGAGLVHLACPEPLYQILEASLTEVLVHPFPATEGGRFAPGAASGIAELAQGMEVVVCGPGLGRGPGPQAVVEALLSSCERVVLDADGLNALAENPSLRKHLTPASPTNPRILTPHPGEFARLWRGTPGEVAPHKLELARKAAESWGAVVVLKGPPTAIANPAGKVFLNTAGNTALAHGGSGDVLAGLIGGLWAQGAEASDAACLGVFLHGRAAELASGGGSERAVLPRDLFPWLSRALRELEGPGLGPCASATPDG